MSNQPESNGPPDRIVRAHDVGWSNAWSYARRGISQTESIRETSRLQMPDDLLLAQEHAEEMERALEAIAKDGCSRGGIGSPCWCHECIASHTIAKVRGTE